MAEVNLTEDQEAVLLVVYKALGHTEDIPHQEKIEMALGALIDSFDSSLDATEEQEEEGNAVNADELRRAVERTLSPDISVDDLVIAEGGEAVVEGSRIKTFEEFAIEEPNNPLVIEAKKGDQHDQLAVAVTFIHFPKSEWAGGQVADLVHRAAKMLREKSQEKNVVDKG